MTRIAVTGATGALGSRAARGVLARLDEQVAALDGEAATSHGASADADAPVLRLVVRDPSRLPADLRQRVEA